MNAISPAPFATETARRAAIAARAPAADGHFVYAVRTTGVYCRPSCPSRAARAENIVLFESPAEARAGGFHPCRRCHPDRAGPPHAGVIARACRRLESAETPPPLAALAGEAGLSPFHFHRLFRAATGLTPRAYGAACRARRLRAGLAAAASVTEALYEAGFNASSRFYDQAGALLGMSPRRWRAGGAGEKLTFATGRCALGAVLVAATERGIAAIDLGDDPAALEAALRRRFPRARIEQGDEAFAAWVGTVVAALETPAAAALPLDIRGTAFQARVWAALRAVPPGQTVAYAELAARIGAPRAVRAVAGACAANPAAIAIPCHRAVRADGALAGYRWGIARKAALLAREAEPGAGKQAK